MVPRFISRLSGKLLILTIIFVLVAEAVIFIPSVASFRKNWLSERAMSAGHLAIALVEAPETFSRKMLADAFMRDTGISVVRTETMGRTELVLGTPPSNPDIKVVDLRAEQTGWQIGAALLAFSEKDGYLRVLAKPPSDEFESLEYLVPRRALQQAIEKYCHNILRLSILIAIMTGLLLYAVLSFLIVRPVKCLADDIEEFRENPEAPIKHKRTEDRKDEIGDLSRSFSDMQESVQSSFEQQKRLADLGLAVSKINHDLRNVLTSAQLVSDRLAMDKDERIRKMGERLVRSVNRGVRIAEGVLEYGSDKTEDVTPEVIHLARLVDEAAWDTLQAYPAVSYDVEIDDAINATADLDFTYRIFQNLIRNAAQAMKETQAPRIRLKVGSDQNFIRVMVSDNGPGLPLKVRETLFTPFMSSGGRGRTGLGLSIAKELAQAQGGDLALVSSDETGTVFEVSVQTN
ncbi:MAG: HAMP domain-containing histidine kinase [Hellea sp.]|nr:HAMP domain-containing histidine kinase [Hellea sp.]